MLPRHKALLGIAAGLLFLLGLLLGFWIPKLSVPVANPNVYNTSTVLKQVRTISELVTVKYVLEKIVILEVPPESLLGQMFAGDNRVLLLAHGIVKAGVDLAELDSNDIEISGSTIRIKLPPARITDAYLDERQTRVIERTTGRFRAFDKNLEQSARQNAVDDLRRAARMSGILKDADDRARAQLKVLLETGDLRVEFVNP